MFYEGCTFDEILAFRDLETEVFDFGEGKMKIEGWYGSEDAYYEMCLEDMYNFEHNIGKPLKENKGNRNRHNINRKQKRKLDKLSNKVWWAVSDEGTHRKRNYLSSRRKFTKRYSNKKVRKYKGVINGGGHYRKIYDYWWNVL